MQEYNKYSLIILIFVVSAKYELTNGYLYFYQPTKTTHEKGN